ncbi:MAG: hypothetical protein ACI81A_002043 [Paraglaciecola sp.]
MMVFYFAIHGAKFRPERCTFFSAIFTALKEDQAFLDQSFLT